MAKFTLKAARVNAGFTQKEVANLLGVSNLTVSNWENGVSYPNAVQIDKICDLYKLHYDNIIFLPESPL